MAISTAMTYYKLTEVMPQLFCVTFNDIYDLSLTFFRYQEFYESRSNNIRGKQFKFLAAMKDYAKKHGKGSFTYTSDFIGFNIPRKCS